MLTVTSRSCCVLLISGGLGRVSQVPQGGVSCASAQPQRDIWDPVWPPAETNAQEHLLGLGQIRGAAWCIGVTSARCPSPRNVSHLVVVVDRFGVINGQICPSTTSEWPCLTTANTATRSTRTSWRCPCEFHPVTPNYRPHVTVNTSIHQKALIHLLTDDPSWLTIFLSQWHSWSQLKHYSN